MLMSNCTMSGTAFLGPVFTGARTGSVYQSSLSLSSAKVINHIKIEKNFKKFSEKLNIKNKDINNSNESYVNKDPYILIAYKVDKIEFSEVLEPEPLP